MMRYVVSVIIILIISLLLLIQIRSCVEQHGAAGLRGVGLLQLDTTIVALPSPEPVRDTVQGETRIVYSTIVQRDSSVVRQIEQLQQQYDSLKNVLSQYQQIVFSTQAIVTHTHDTLRIECDELTHNIAYDIRYAARTAAIERKFITLPSLQSPLPSVSRGPGLGICAGAGIGSDGIFRATLAVGLLYGYYIH